MIYVLGQATQKNGTTPTWTLSGICTEAERVNTGTYAINIDLSNLPNIDRKDLVILLSAERGNTGTERLTINWSQEINNRFLVKNYSGYNSTTLGDCMLTVTILANIG